jgi:hypothetical protein
MSWTDGSFRIVKEAPLTECGLARKISPDRTRGDNATSLE